MCQSILVHTLTNADCRQRQIFFLDDNGLVLTANTTTNAWPEAYNILNDDSAAPNTRALAAYSIMEDDANSNFNGIRVYYGEGSKDTE